MHLFQLNLVHLNTQYLLHKSMIQQIMKGLQTLGKNDYSFIHKARSLYNDHNLYNKNNNSFLIAHPYVASS